MLYLRNLGGLGSRARMRKESAAVVKSVRKALEFLGFRAESSEVRGIYLSIARVGEARG